MTLLLSQLPQLSTGPTPIACLNAASVGLQSAVRLLGLDDEGCAKFAQASFDETDRMVSISFDTLGGAEGALVLLMTEDEALDVARLLLRRFDAPSVSSLDENAKNALAEVGNILASSFLNHLSGLLHTSCLPSVPSLQVATLESVLSTSFSSMDAEWVSIELHIGETSFWLLFHPSEKTTRSLSA